MRKNSLILTLGLAALLGIVAALALVIAANGTQPKVADTGEQPAAATSEQDADLEAPAANMPLDTNFKAQPATGPAVSLPWANIKVNPDTSKEAHNEPFVAVDPQNANHIVVGANSWQVGNGNYEVFAYVSFDGGKTWTASQPYINRNANRINAADPTIAFGSDGTVYFAFVALSPADGAVAVSRSNDGGRTWASQTWATSFNTGSDKPAIAAGGGKLYLFYQNQALYNSVSADGGSTWSNASQIEVGGRNANPVVDSKGNVSVFYNTENAIKLARMGALSTRPVTVANAVPLQARQARYRAGIYPAGAVDSRGNFYVAWADGRNTGRGNDILYSHSVDGGNTWSAPLTVNTDGGAADQLMPALAVGSDGVVTVAWLDNRNDPANINYDVYMARGTGASFGANQRVTTVSSNPNNDPRTQGTMIGDYFALAAGNGFIYPAWTDTRNNQEDIYMAPIPVSGIPNN